MSRTEPIAYVGGFTGRGLLEVCDDADVLDRSGRWAVVQDFEGALTCARFAEWSPGPPHASELGDFQGPAAGEWRSSLAEDQYVRAVARIRELIAAGEVYQVNLCRTLSAQLPQSRAQDPIRLGRALDLGNPAPFSAALRIDGLQIASASPELYLSRAGARLSSGPIKGTGVVADDLSEKDRAENVMIVDLVRNDLARVCTAGTVAVPELLRIEQHPGLVHLVSTISGQLRNSATWAEILNACSPPGSVSGAPKLAALDVIRSLEPTPRGPYCGAIGWVDADVRSAELAVGIRTFWIDDGRLHFGTGAGITWGSDPDAEWRETELKAAHLIGLATGA